jgi:hypothetical protein
MAKENWSESEKGSFWAGAKAAEEAPHIISQR